MQVMVCLFQIEKALLKRGLYNKVKNSHDGDQTERMASGNQAQRPCGGKARQSARLEEAETKEVK